MSTANAFRLVNSGGEHCAANVIERTRPSLSESLVISINLIQENCAVNRFRTVFHDRHVVLPVIHVATLEQAIRNAQIAQQAGANGVFLINHGSSVQELLQIHAEVAARFPGYWIGVNCLGLCPDATFCGFTNFPDGVWVDNAQIHEDRQTQADAQAVLNIQKQQGWNGLYFGGVAFKYQRAVKDLAGAAKIATGYMDVVTTSGPGTGKAAMPEKIRVMKEAMGDHPLAIASGVTPENIFEYLPFADCFLVATGISQSFDELDLAKVRSLVERVRSYRRS